MGQNATDQLLTHEMKVLDDACSIIAASFGCPYLVGSAGYDGRKDYRDIDVRLILSDEEFDTFCPSIPHWTLLSMAIGALLRERTGLPIDFQIQRQTEANAKHSKPRNPLGLGRDFAGGGDATPWLPDGFSQRSDTASQDERAQQ